MTKKYNIEKNILNLRGSLLEVMRCVKRYEFHAGDSCHNRCVKVWIDPPDYLLFTPIVFNRLVRKFRDYYGGIVLLEIRYTRKLKEHEKYIPTDI